MVGVVFGLRGQRPPELAVLGGGGEGACERSFGVFARARAHARGQTPRCGAAGGVSWAPQSGWRKPCRATTPSHPPRGSLSAVFPQRSDGRVPHFGRRLQHWAAAAHQRPGIQSNLNVDEPATSGSLGERHATQERALSNLRSAGVLQEADTIVSSLNDEVRPYVMHCVIVSELLSARLKGQSIGSWSNTDRYGQAPLDIPDCRPRPRPRHQGCRWLLPRAYDIIVVVGRALLLDGEGASGGRTSGRWPPAALPCPIWTYRYVCQNPVDNFLPSPPCPPSLCRCWPSPP